MAVGLLENIAREWISLWSVPVNWEAFDRIHSDEFKECSSGVRGTSKKDFASGLAAFMAAFPDLQTDIEDLVIDETTQRIAVRWLSTGTNKLTYLGVGPTYNKINIRGIEIIEINEERVQKRWGEWDISEHIALP